MPTAPLNNVELFYRDEGVGQPLLILHGTAMTGDGMMGLGRALNRRGGTFRLVVPDLRGHGRSTNPTGSLSPATLLNDVVALLHHLQLKRIHTLGFSLGGYLALLLSLAHPELVDTQVLLGTNFRADDHLRQGFQRLRPEWIETHNPYLAQFFSRQHSLHHGPLYWRDLLGQLAAEQWSQLEAADLMQVRAPTLVVVGDRDEFISLEQALDMRRYMPLAELLVLPGTGHVDLINRPRYHDHQVDFYRRHAAL